MYPTHTLPLWQYVNELDKIIPWPCAAEPLKLLSWLSSTSFPEEVSVAEAPNLPLAKRGILPDLVTTAVTSQLVENTFSVEGPIGAKLGILVVGAPESVGEDTRFEDHCYPVPSSIELSLRKNELVKTSPHFNEWLLRTMKIRGEDGKLILSRTSWLTFSEVIVKKPLEVGPPISVIEVKEGTDPIRIKWLLHAMSPEHLILFDQSEGAAQILDYIPKDNLTMVDINKYEAATDKLQTIIKEIVL